MPADPRQTARLRELHQDFAWKVNAAVAAGRDDLVDALCEEYAEEAVRLLTGAPPDHRARRRHHPDPTAVGDPCSARPGPARPSTDRPTAHPRDRPRPAAAAPDAAAGQPARRAAVASGSALGPRRRRRP